jgi:GT2 family glycosyltransferase
MNIGIITPVKNEAENLPRLFESMRAQSVHPRRWVIVDDGSTDESAEMITAFTEEMPWAVTASTGSDSSYDIGAHYARVLATGYEHLAETLHDELDYYMVLDGDMELSKRYLETIASFMDRNPEVAIASGQVMIRQPDGSLEAEYRLPNEPCGGATLYRGPFYREIGGPPPTPCVDSVTKTKARLRGFECRHLRDEAAEVIQARPTGGHTSGAAQLGTENYQLRYHPAFALAKAASMCLRSPHRAGLDYARGYISGWVDDVPRVGDPEVQRYYRYKKPLEFLGNLRQGVFGRGN